MPVNWDEFEPVQSASTEKVDWSEFEPTENNFPAPDALKPKLERPPIVSTTAGGPQLGGFNMRPLTKDDFIPDAESVRQVAADVTGESHPNIPKFEIDPRGSKTAAVLKSAANLPIGVGNFMLSPAGGLSLAAGSVGPLAARLLTAGFAGQTVKSAYDQQKELRKDWKDLTPAQKAAGITDLTGTIGFAGLLTKGALKKPAAVSPEKAQAIQEAAPILPQAAQEAAKTVIEQPQPTETPDASSEQKTATVHGDVQPQPVEGQPEVPAQESGRGVQPPETPKGEVSLTPAIKVADKLFTGSDHVDAYKNAKNSGQPDTSGAQEGFVNPQGQFLTREQAAKASGLPTESEAGKLHSSDLGEKPINPGGALKDLPKELQDKSNAVKDAMRAEFEKLKAQAAQPNPIVDQPVNKYRIGTNPSTYSLVERLPQSETEKANAEHPVRVKNDRTGEVQTVMESDLKAVKEGVKTTAPKRDLDAELKKVGMDPSVFQNRGQKVEALKRAQAMKAMPPGPGAATRPPTEGEGYELPSDPGNPDIYGVAERVREERAKAGQVESVEPGQGISAADSVERGRELLKSSDPEKVMSDFEKSGKLSGDDMAVARARGEQLAFDARRIEEKFGTDSDEYRKAFKDLSDWDKRSKAMQTEWHKTGQAQQGETDIDTGSFTGLQRAFKEDAGKDFTPEQAKKAKKVAKESQKADEEAAVAKKKLFDHFSQSTLTAERTPAEERALAAASKTVREAAARTAKADAKALEVEQARKLAVEKMERLATDKALAAANKTVREAAIKRARDAAKSMERQADLAKKAAQESRKAEEKAREAVAKFHREEAVRRAKAEEKRLNDPQWDAWNRVRDYIATGKDDFDDIRNKVATDMGIPVDRLTRLLSQSQKTKYLADDVWRKQQISRRVRDQAKMWLKAVESPVWEKAIKAIPRILFSMKVGFHGTVALGTHAPMVAFQPRFWGKYITDFGKMYKMVGSPAYYERQVQDLMRRPNWVLAKRSGLVNDPFVFEDYNSPKTSASFGRLTGMGNRGYSVLKILRQDMFDQMWNKLPDTTKTPEVASALADGINHATGVVKAKAPAGANLAFFAPRLEMSRVAWLYGDPIRAVRAFANWSNASEAEKVFAINQVKEKAWVAGTFFSALAANQGMLTATGSDQKINFTDPMRSDFLKFKVAGSDVSYGNAMLTMARFPVRLYAIRESDGGKLKNLIYPDEDTYTVLGEYARSQLSPAASLGLDLWLKSDWMRRPLPNSNRPEPSRLRRQGVVPYTWPEYLTETASPIPAVEPWKEVWKQGFGMTDEQMKTYGKAFAKAMVMGATGARLEDDRNRDEKR